MLKTALVLFAFLALVMLFGCGDGGGGGARLAGVNSRDGGTTVRLLPGESGAYTFSGVLSVDGRVLPITGDRQSR